MRETKQSTGRDRAKTPQPFSGLPIRVVGPIPDIIGEICRTLDPAAEFLLSTASIWPTVTSVDEANPVLVVSTTLDERDCRRVLRDEAARPIPTALGFVVGPDAEFVERRLRALQSGPPPSLRGPIGAFLDSPLSEIALPGIETAGSVRQPVAESARRVQEPFAALILYGHSNGICHGAGGLAICVRDSRAPRENVASQMPCFGGHSCRFDGNDSLNRVPVEDLRSPIVIDLTCFGYTLRDHAFLADDGLGKALLNRVDAQALVTSLRAFTPNHYDYVLAACLLLEGRTLGGLVAALNRARMNEAGQKGEFICIGDPRVRLVPHIRYGGRMESLNFSLETAEKDVINEEIISLGAAPARQEVLLHSGTEAAAWAPDGRIYVAKKPGEGGVHLQRVATCEARSAIDFRQLLPGLDFLEHYLAGLSNHKLADESPALAKALGKADKLRIQLREFALKVHPRIIRDGGAIDKATLISLTKHRGDLLVALCRSLQTIHLHTLTARSLLFEAGASVLSEDGLESDGKACPYCGAGTCLTCMHLAGSRFSRTAVFCDRCGRVCEGEGLATEIRLEPAESGLSVRVEVSNPYEFDVPIGGVAALQSFDGCYDVETEFSMQAVSAGQDVWLAAELDTPLEIPPGMHRVKAAICVGSRVELLMRYCPVPFE